MPISLSHHGLDTVLKNEWTPVNLTEHWFSASYWQQREKIVGQSRGRNSTYFVDYGSGQAALRHYWRGGMIGKLLSDQYWWRSVSTTRVHREFSLLTELFSLGLPVPRPIAGKFRRHGFWYSADLLTERIPASHSLLDLLKLAPVRSELLQAIGQTIAQFHRQGIYHADLNINNIMLDEQDRVYLIDFDRGERRAPARQWQQANITRLHRSFNKETLRHPMLFWRAEQWPELLRYYQQAMEAK